MNSPAAVHAFPTATPSTFDADLLAAAKSLASATETLSRLLAEIAARRGAR